MSAETDLRARLIAERENARTADEIVVAVSPAPTPGVANGARYVVALPFPRGANGGSRGTRSTSSSRSGSVDKCSRPSRSVASAGVRRAVTRYPQGPPAQARPPTTIKPARARPSSASVLRAIEFYCACAPHLAGALVVVGWAAPLRAGLIAELGDGAAARELVACVVRRHGGRLPIARRPGASAKPPGGRPAPGYARPNHTALRTPRSPWCPRATPKLCVLGAKRFTLRADLQARGFHRVSPPERLLERRRYPPAPAPCRRGTLLG